MNDLDRYIFELQKTKLTRFKPEELRELLLKDVSPAKLEAWRNSNWYIPRNHFEKWHACGNDFVLVSEPAEGVPTWKMCDRHFGVGGDGLIFLLPSEVADVRMCIINSDGTEAEMCGNGIRCLGLCMSRKLNRNKVTVETKGGVKELVIDGLDVRVNMGGVTPLWNRLIELPGREYDAFHLSIGNPHCVLLVNDTEEGEVEKYGPLIENSINVFPDRTNVEFLMVKSRRRIRVKVWERGCGRTLGCGTGACAAASVAYDRGHVDDIVTVELDGGEVEVEVGNLPYGDIYLNGMAHYVYSGAIYEEDD